MVIYVQGVQMKYPKVLSLGSFRTEHALNGIVTIQEKVDGSQFRWGTEDGKELIICSKNRRIQPEQAGMFKLGVDHLISMWEKLGSSYQIVGTLPLWFFGEYLSKPKHNTLCYDNVPKNNIVLFDVYRGTDYVPRDAVKEYAKHWDVDAIPEFYNGTITRASLHEFHEKESYLGGTKIEGIVIKNYNEIIEINGQVRPLITKYVSTEFREKHGSNPDHKPLRATIEEWIQGFKTEARWEKAVQSLRDDNKLIGEPRDIGNIIKQVILDIDEEETDNIKEYLFSRYIKPIHATAVSRVAEWYKDKLLENVK